MADLSCISKILKQLTVLGWTSKNLKLMLLTENHIPNAITQNYVSDVIANEIVDTADIYISGGVSLNNLAAKADPDNPSNYFLDADDVVLGPGVFINYRFGIIYEDMGTGNHAVNPIYGQIDFIENQIISRGISTIAWNQLGIIYHK